VSDSKQHDLHDFIQRAQADLQAEYSRIQKRATEDPGTAGDQGEENWATLFREWLARDYYVVTKGRILTTSGFASPQMDVLILCPSYPRILLDKKLYLAGGVVAASECKTTLTAKHVEEAVTTCALLKDALPKREGSPFKELYADIVYGLLAHSHSWKGENSKPLKNIEVALWAADYTKTKHPREMIDFITISDLATWQCHKLTYMAPRHLTNDELKKIYGPNGCAVTSYVCHAIGGNSGGLVQKEFFSPIGVLLSGMFSRLAWHSLAMRPLEEYLRKVNVGGSGQGSMRQWPIEIYSEGIRKRLLDGQLKNGVSYDEWSVAFI
jgi:hypothetical protein